MGDHAHVTRWQQEGSPDNKAPFPWELRDLLRKNESYETVFVHARAIGQASGFVHGKSWAQAQTVMSGGTVPTLGGLIEKGGPALSGGQGGATSQFSSGIVAAARGFGSVGNSGLFGTQVLPGFRPPSAPPNPGVCHRFVAGAEASSMPPLKVFGDVIGSTVCLSSKVHTLLAAHVGKPAKGVAPTAAVIGWNPKGIGSQWKQRHSPSGSGESGMTCLARVAFEHGGVALVENSVAVEETAVVLLDSLTKSLITVNSVRDALVVNQFDAATLVPRYRYTLPLSAGWFLHASRMANGYLLIVGVEKPYLGSVLTIDLKNLEMYEQDAPRVVDAEPRGGRGRDPPDRPQRRKLPRRRVERLDPLVADRSALDEVCPVGIYPIDPPGGS